LSLGALEDPVHNITSAFAGGAASVPFNKGLTFYFAFWAMASFIYLLISLRTNVAFAVSHNSSL
ncbi:hypothetical protein BT96DRAFT_813269, partial [Gymnopus androsaceus JB14]